MMDALGCLLLSMIKGVLVGIGTGLAIIGIIALFWINLKSD